MGPWIEIAISVLDEDAALVVPYVGTWIEIIMQSSATRYSAVVPYVGTWIEISCCSRIYS